MYSNEQHVSDAVMGQVIWRQLQTFWWPKVYHTRELNGLMFARDHMNCSGTGRHTSGIGRRSPASGFPYREQQPKRAVLFNVFVTVCFSVHATYVATCTIHVNLTG